MTIVPKKKSESRSASKSSVAPPKNKPQQDKEDQEPHEHHHTNQPAHHRLSPHLQCSTSGDNVGQDVDYSGYNSGDEHTDDRRPASYTQWTEQDFLEQENEFEKTINKKGWAIRKMAEDGACLFRAVADQIYGDQDMHSVLRKLCIDYIAKNSDYFSQYVTEDFGEYLKRKSLDHSHGNHIEIQAMSEMFNRPIEVYHYSNEPINIFQGPTSDNEPIRLSYHRSVHYNSIVDPFKATVGVGLGLPAYDPGVADKTLLEDAIRLSDEDAIEKAMLEDKLLATDWEATNEAIEQQVARESYLEWVRENESRLHKKFKKSSSPQPTTAAASSKQTTPTRDQQQQQNRSSSPSPSSSSTSHHLELVASCSKSSSHTSYGPTCSSNLNDTYQDSCGQAGTSTSSSSPSQYGNSSGSPSGSGRRSPRASSSHDIS